MSKSKDPAFMLYSQDFLVGTATYANAETGLYIKLLCIQHQHGGLIEKDFFLESTKDCQRVRQKFIETDDGFFNERLMDEMVKREKKSKNLSKNAKIRWEKHRKTGKKNDATVDANASANAYANNIQMDTNRHMPIENENEIGNEIEEKGGTGGKEEKTENPKIVPGYIVSDLAKRWYEHFPDYPCHAKSDLEAIGRIIFFIRDRHAISEITEGRHREMLVGTIDAIASVVSKDSFWVNKPLKSIANNIQEFYIQLNNAKNGRKNKQSEKQHGFNEVLEAIDRRFKTK